MHKIKFRGKRVDTKEWVYGSLIIDENRYFIVDSVPFLNKDEVNTYMEIFSFEVILETAGQFTGLVDKNGNEIYEGDIIKFQDQKNVEGGVKENFTNVGAVNYIDNMFNVTERNMVDNEDAFYECEVIGNIYDNKELLEV